MPGNSRTPSVTKHRQPTPESTIPPAHKSVPYINTTPIISGRPMTKQMRTTSMSILKSPPCKALSGKATLKYQLGGDASKV